MNSFIHKHHRILFFFSWLILGLIQSRFTELQDDEAYYWVYSKYPDIGYFDHPPMIALLIKMGYTVFLNELGVRLFPLLLNVLSLLLIEKLLDKKNPFLFYLIAVSMAALQLGGFTAVPDIPLIFFTALFFLWYKKFLDKQSFANTILLAISIALLFYTKYHSVLIVFFTLLSNTRLFKRRQLWLSGFIAFIFFIPHLLWQWEHNWVSFRYHLFESNVDPYKISYTTEYLAGQLLAAGPIAGLILLPAAFLYKTKSPTEKAMKWTMAGIYIFFLLSSFRGKVEINWTAPALVPLIVLSHQYLNEKLSWQRWLQRIAVVTLLLVLFMRFAMILDFLPLKAVQLRYHAWKKWPQQMKQLTGGLPVVFSNSYQRASKYWFYSGQLTYSQNDISEHRNNYNFWPIEDQMIGKPVYFLDIYRLNRFTDSLKTPIGYLGYRYDSSFLSFATFKIGVCCTKKIQTADSLNILFRRYRGSPHDYYLKKHALANYSAKLVFFDGKNIIKEISIPLRVENLKVKSEEKFTVYPGLPKGKYQFILSLEVPGYNATHNSEKIKLIIQ